MFPLQSDIATPVSHHFADRQLGTQLAGFSDTLELRDNGIEPPKNAHTDLIYHSEVDAAVEWMEQERTQLAKIQSLYDPELVSVHLASRYQEVDVQDGRFIGVGDPYDREQLLTHVEENIETVREIFGETPVLIENNNHLGTDAYEIVTDPSFIDTVVRRTDIGLLLDVGHAKITAHNTAVEYDDYLRQLPLDRCRQVHLSRHAYDETGAVDAHAFLTAADWDHFDTIRSQLPKLTYVTLEYYTDATVLAAQLERMQTGTSRAVFTHRIWESELFNTTVASVTSDPTTAECLRYAITRCAESDVDCLFFETESSRERDAAVAQGFELIETQSVFEHTSDADHSLEDADDIRTWQYTDLPYLQELAGSLSDSTRYHTDSQFDTENCDELRSPWIHHVCQEVVDEVFVAIADGVPVGFSTCTVTDGVGEIGLVGVEETVSDETVGPRLLTAAVEWCRDHNITQVRGTAETANDQQPYRSAGFTPTAERYVLHRWFDSETPS